MERRITVPGSTSNLGPGFDLLGLALSLELSVRLAPRPSGSPQWVERRGEAAEWPGDESDLVTRAFDRLAGDGAHRAYAFSAESEIPLGSGFGSSGAAVAAGLLAAASVAETPPDRAELFRLGLELEGHPDNLGPSLFGGCQLLVAGDEGWIREEIALHDRLRFAVAWPREPMSTRDARAALPPHPSRDEAVGNAGRLALLLRGLERGDPDLLRAGAVDRLHVPHRLPLLPGAREALEAAHAAGAFAATLSGSGSGLFAVADETTVEAVAEALRAALHEATGHAEARVLSVAGRP